MELETLIGYLVALAVPLWLVVEGVLLFQRSPKHAAKRSEVGKVSRKPASRAPVRATISPRA